MKKEKRNPRSHELIREMIEILVYNSIINPAGGQKIETIQSHESDK